MPTSRHANTTNTTTSTASITIAAPLALLPQPPPPLPVPMPCLCPVTYHTCMLHDMPLHLILPCLDVALPYLGVAEHATASHSTIPRCYLTTPRCCTASHCISFYHTVCYTAGHCTSYSSGSYILAGLVLLGLASQPQTPPSLPLFSECRTSNI